MGRKKEEEEKNPEKVVVGELKVILTSVNF